VLVVFDDELAVGIVALVVGMVVMELVGGQMGWQVGVFAAELAGAVVVDEPVEAVVVDEAGRVVDSSSTPPWLGQSVGNREGHSMRSGDGGGRGGGGKKLVTCWHFNDSCTI